MEIKIIKKKLNNKAFNLKKDTTHNKSKKNPNNRKKIGDNRNDTIILNAIDSKKYDLVTEKHAEDIRFNLFPLKDNISLLISKMDKLKIFHEDRILFKLNLRKYNLNDKIFKKRLNFKIGLNK